MSATTSPYHTKVEAHGVLSCAPSFAAPIADGWDDPDNPGVIVVTSPVARKCVTTGCMLWNWLDQASLGASRKGFCGFNKMPISLALPQPQGPGTRMTSTGHPARDT
jgi:hypothetical protein